MELAGKVGGLGEKKEKIKEGNGDEISKPCEGNGGEISKPCEKKRREEETDERR